MLFLAYSTLLLCVGLAGIRPQGPGEGWRLVAVAAGIVILLTSLSLAVDAGHHTTVSAALFGGLIGGSAVFTAGALKWTGPAAFWWRTAGWCGMAAALVVPSTLTLGLPILGLLAFTLRPAADPAAAGIPLRSG